MLTWYNCSTHAPRATTEDGKLMNSTKTRPMQSINHGAESALSRQVRSENGLLIIMLLATMAFAACFVPPSPAVERFAAAMTVSASVPTALTPLIIDPNTAFQINTPPALMMADASSSAIVLGGASAFVQAALALSVIALVGQQYGFSLTSTPNSAEDRARAAAALAASEDSEWNRSWDEVMGEVTARTTHPLSLARAIHSPVPDTPCAVCVSVPSFQRPSPTVAPTAV